MLRGATLCCAHAAIEIDRCFVAPASAVPERAAAIRCCVDGVRNTCGAPQGASCWPAATHEFTMRLSADGMLCLPLSSDARPDGSLLVGS